MYSNLNLKISRTFKKGDGLPDTEKLGYACKPVDLFDRRMIELQKSYAHDLLTHKNPYTGLKYVDEPAIAVVEMNNENTLIGDNWFGSLNALPDFYQKELSGLWSDWLKKKYTSSVGLKKAWSANDKPFGHNLAKMDSPGWTLENNTAPAASEVVPADPKMTPPKGVTSPIRTILVSKVGTQNWNIQYNCVGLDLVEGESYTFSFWAKAEKSRQLAINSSIDRSDYHGIGLSATADVSTEWKFFTYSFKASRVERSHNRIGVFLGDSEGRVDFCGLSVNSGVKAELPANLNLESGRVALSASGETPQGKDWTSFLVFLEGKYVSEMRSYLKDDLKLKSMAICSQSNFGGVAGIVREAQNDFIDTHTYWQHPDFPHKSWDLTDWFILNTPMFGSETGGEFNQLVRYRVAGKPYTVSEYMHPAPNDFQAECVPMISAFASCQDWDGFYLFDYGMDRGENRIANFFAIDANPAKMALMPAMARLFLRGDLEPVSNVQQSIVTYADQDSLIRMTGATVGALWPKAYIDSRLIAGTRYEVVFNQKPGVASAITLTPERKTSGHSQLTWTSNSNAGNFSSISPKSKLILGSIGGTKLNQDGWKVSCESGATRHNFAVVSLTSLDGSPISKSKSLLLTAVARVENKGMKWNEKRTSVGDQWGDGPAIAEGVSGSFELQTSLKSAAVYALDGTGKRVRSLPSRLNSGVLTFSLSNDTKTLWYEIELK